MEERRFSGIPPGMHGAKGPRSRRCRFAQPPETGALTLWHPGGMLEVHNKGRRKNSVVFYDPSKVARGWGVHSGGVAVRRCSRLNHRPISVNPPGWDSVRSVEESKLVLGLNDFPSAWPNGGGVIQTFAGVERLLQRITANF